MNLKVAYLIPQLLKTKKLHKEKDFVDAEFKNLKSDMFVVMKFKVNKYSFRRILKEAITEPCYHNYLIKDKLLQISFKFPDRLKRVTLTDSDGDLIYTEYDLKRGLSFFVE